MLRRHKLETRRQTTTNRRIVVRVYWCCLREAMGWISILPHASQLGHPFVVVTQLVGVIVSL